MAHTYQLYLFKQSSKDKKSSLIFILFSKCDEADGTHRMHRWKPEGKWPCELGADKKTIL